MPTAALAMFTADQKSAVCRLLQSGMDPEQISRYLARLNDLDEIAEMFLHQLATGLVETYAPQ